MWQYNYMNSDELYHYGVLGMKWGVRRATYKAYSSNHLKRSRAKIEKDLVKLKKKKLKADEKAAKNMMKGKTEKAGKKMKKSYKRGKTILHNEKLLTLYDKRITELDSKLETNGQKQVKKLGLA